MTKICIISYEEHFSEIFSTREPVIVHSVFSNAVNLCSDGVLYTLMSGKEYTAPYTASIAPEAMRQLNVRAGERLLVSGQELIGSDNQRICLSPDGCQRLRPVRRAFCPSCLQAGTLLLLQRLECLRERSPLCAVVLSLFSGSLRVHVRDPFGELLVKRALRVMQELDRNDFSHVSSLIGAGAGLTPAGDDFLCGMLTALCYMRLPEAGEKFRLLGEAVENSGYKEKTTDVAARALELAMQGRSAQPYLDFTEALFGNDEYLNATIDLLETIGHSSGIDVACGIAAALWLLRGNIFLTETTGSA